MKKAVLSRYLFFSAVAACSGMYLLFAISEHRMHHDNGFIRRFPFKVQETGRVELSYNSYYYAGAGGGQLYLGNYTAPLSVVTLDLLLGGRKDYRLQLSDTSYAFRSLQLRVSPPLFYMADGNVPVVYKGAVSDWNATVAIEGTTAFLRYAVIDSSAFACTYIDPVGNAALGLQPIVKGGSLQPRPGLLQKQVDGLFDCDGMLHFDPATQNHIYLYHYRNEYIVTDAHLRLLYRGHTIDTNSRAKIEVAYLKGRREKKLAGSPLVVNRKSAVEVGMLYVLSALRGRYEPEDLWEAASVIDVYDIRNRTYVSSFYIYPIGTEKLHDFFVVGGKLYAFIGTQLVRYDLPQKLRTTVTLP